MQEIMRGVGEAIHGELPTREAMDFLPLENGPLLDAAQKNGVTLFRK